MPIQVIGAGLGRTGTLSLKAALEELGFAKCYHMVEVFARKDDARTWDAASRGESVDWDRLFAGYRATVDVPACLFYRELLEKYPGAKVVLTCAIQIAGMTACARRSTSPTTLSRSGPPCSIPGCASSDE